ncbi:hypothetical protein AK830_g11860 [Neonectria ditissima]|uniref:Uncharacterized protein n=1 Tax=Neonectria ditissima TaxID=78410 RepID=A0A0P7AQI5_9HYPO|nr:hypothetical protein AK830_g11860 [Neonectria ditissima]
MLGDADQETHSVSQPTSHSLGCVFGSIFAGSVIDALTSASTPLLDCTPSDVLDGTSLQPQDAHDEQTATYNAFCQSILDSCMDRVHHTWHELQFTSSAQEHNWGHSWTGRNRTSLARSEQRRNALPTTPYTGDEDAKLNLKPHPGNPSSQGNAGPSRTGVPIELDEDSLVHAMTTHILHHRTADMAKLFLKTSPNDWSRGWGQFFCGHLLRTARGDPPAEDEPDMYTSIRFQWELGLTADYMVQRFGLPVPNNQMCITWDDHEWRRHAGPGIASFQQKYTRVYNTFQRGHFQPVPTATQLRDCGFRIPRFTNYMVAAVVEADLPEESTNALTSQLLAFMDTAKKSYTECVMQDPAIVGPATAARLGSGWPRGKAKATSRRRRRPLLLTDVNNRDVEYPVSFQRLGPNATYGKAPFRVRPQYVPRAP